MPRACPQPLRRGPLSARAPGMFGRVSDVGHLSRKRPTRRPTTCRSLAFRRALSEARLRKLMRARRVATQSELIKTLLAEEEERLRSHAVLRNTARTVRAGDVDDRLL